MAFTITNLLRNPSFETNATDWQAAGAGTMARSTSEGYSGPASYRSQSNGGVAGTGVEYGRQVVAATTGQVVTASVWAKGSGTIQLAIRENTAAGGFVAEGQTSSVVLTGTYQRISHTRTLSGGVTVAFVSIRVRHMPLTVCDFYCDAAMLTLGSTLYDYFDGSTANGTWTGTPHASTSVWTNTLPVVSAGTDTEVGVDGVFSQAGSFTDSTGTSWTATVNYGEGAGAGVLSLVGTDFTLSHTYAAPGEYTVTVTVTDNYGDAGVDTILVTVPAPSATDDANDLRNRKIAAAIAAGAV